MARFDSPGDAILVCVAFYEKTKAPGQNFTEWMFRQVQSLVAGGYILDEGAEPPSPEAVLLLGHTAGAATRNTRFRYHLTDRGQATLDATLAGEDQNPVHLPDMDTRANAEMMRELRDRQRRGARVFSFPTTLRDT